jgi:hypothetical protein
VKANVEAFSEPCGEVASGFAGVDAEFAGAVETAEESAGVGGGGELVDFGGGEEIAGDLELLGGGEKFLEEFPFVGVMSEVNGATGADAETCFSGDREPALAAEECGLEGCTVRLSDGPDHTEIADGGSCGAWGAFEDGDVVSAFCG